MTHGVNQRCDNSATRRLVGVINRRLIEEQVVDQILEVYGGRRQFNQSLKYRLRLQKIEHQCVVGAFDRLGGIPVRTLIESFERRLRNLRRFDKVDRRVSQLLKQFRIEQ